MNNRLSFSSLEKEFTPRMRSKINNAEDVVDLENHFSFTIVSLLKRVFPEGNIDIRMDDIVFDPRSKRYYSVSPRLTGSLAFQELWQSSDLENVLFRFADKTYRRYMHLCKHPAKTEKKIRN